MRSTSNKLSGKPQNILPSESGRNNTRERNGRGRNRG